MKSGLIVTAIALTGCSTTYQADPTTFAHLSCEQLRTMYNPDSELLIPPLGDAHPGDSNYVKAQPNQREWTYDEDLREKRSKFRSDVRAAYRSNNCSSSNKAETALSNSLGVDETELAARLEKAGINLETLEKQVEAEVAWRKAQENQGNKKAPPTN